MSQNGYQRHKHGTPAAVSLVRTPLAHAYCAQGVWSTWVGTFSCSLPPCWLAHEKQTNEGKAGERERSLAPTAHVVRRKWYAARAGLFLSLPCSYRLISCHLHRQQLVLNRNTGLRSTDCGSICSTRYAPAVQLTRFTADDGFGTDGRQSYGETFGKYSASSLRSQNYSSGYISSPGK